MSILLKTRTPKQNLIKHSDEPPAPLRDRRLMLFDLALGGHHGNYIRHLIDYWCEQNLPGNLDIVVAPEFFEVHYEVAEAIAQYQHPKIKLVAIATTEATALRVRGSAWDRVGRNLQEWRLYCHYAKLLQASHSLLMYLDTSEIPLSLGKGSPCPFSGIYFRPTFHYDSFQDRAASKKEKLQHLRERFTLSRILANPQLKNLFCLDPFAIKHLNQFKTQARVQHLPDPVEIDPSNLDSSGLKQQLKIESGRKVFLLFGALDERKGVAQLLEAIAELPTQLCQKICLLIVGGTHKTIQDDIQRKLEPIRATKPVQIIEKYEFIPEPEVSNYFQLTDVVLAPYQRHVGMSGILLLAAAAGKPVLSSNYGLMGEMVRRYELGIGVDSTLPQEIADGLTECLRRSPQDWGNQSKMQTFVRQNSVNNYTKVIFNSIKY